MEDILLYDVFICHAGEDKDNFVRPLAESLRSKHIEVWYDEFVLNVGDSIREAIDKGLRSCRFGIVVLSPDFFEKGWPNWELDGLVNRHIQESPRLILPVWHNVGRKQVEEFSPPLANLWAASSVAGMNAVIDQLVRKIRPEESPLLIAREFLIEKGVPVPVITDEWWLDIVEIKEAYFLHPDLNRDWRWIFPLPFPDGSQGKQRGLNIAWTALQLNWSRDARERDICQLTHPDEVHAFLKQWPGLNECAYRNAATLALYAPQITIPGFDDEFADVFDELNSPAKVKECDAFRYGRAQTTDGNNPLCGDLIAWRHPTYGNYTPLVLAQEFATAHNGTYSREVFSEFECLVWLLSHDSNWMPTNLKAVLKQGFQDWPWWWMRRWSLPYGGIVDRALSKPRNEFSYTKGLRAEITQKCEQALHDLKINDDPKRIADCFIQLHFFETYLEDEDRRREGRTTRQMKKI